jgi:hypothetical protein
MGGSVDLGEMVIERRRRINPIRRLVKSERSGIVDAIP